MRILTVRAAFRPTKCVFSRCLPMLLLLLQFGELRRIWCYGKFLEGSWGAMQELELWQAFNRDLESYVGFGVVTSF